MEKKEVVTFTQNQCQSYVDKILAALNPVNARDLPFIALALNKLLGAIENDLDEEQKKAYEAARDLIGASCNRTNVHKVPHISSASNAYSAKEDFSVKNCKEGGNK